MKLSQEQLESYRENGFIVLGSVMDDAQLEELRAEEARVRALPFVKTDGTIEPDGLTIFRSQLADYSEPVRRFCTQGAQIEVVKQIVGPNIALWFNQYVTKLPDNPQRKLSEFPWHQDNGYGNIEPQTNVTIWCALDDVTEENGCVWVIPQSHKQGVVPHTPVANSWHFIAEKANAENEIPVPLRAGEAVLFSGLMLHRSKQNFSGAPRRAFFMEYADAAAYSESEGKPIVKSATSWLVAGALPWPQPKSE